VENEACRQVPAARHHGGPRFKGGGGPPLVREPRAAGLIQTGRGRPDRPEGRIGGAEHGVHGLAGEIADHDPNHAPVSSRERW
jgi:hypothetical protein